MSFAMSRLMFRSLFVDVGYMERFSVVMLTGEDGGIII